MKRLHVHISVPDLAESIGFYSSLFGAAPSKQKSDYAKWQLDDPRVNFAISTRSAKIGLDHLGIQVEESAELDAINNSLKQSAQPVGEMNQGLCCYAESTKFWTLDKAGIPWESFITMNDAEVYGADTPMPSDSACCDSEPGAQAAQKSCC